MATQADLDRLDAAIASGVTQVRFADGRSVTYATITEMLAARAFLASQVSVPMCRTTRSSFARD